MPRANHSAFKTLLNMSISKLFARAYFTLVQFPYDEIVLPFLLAQQARA